ncbi:MAG: aminotransferase class I/II-fold pyridoxal phosphate-dependent enzyme [Rickettsiales bacterium]
MTSLDLYCANNLAKLEKTQTLRKLKNVSILKQHKLIYKSQILENFASNDYYGLAEHQDVTEAAIKALEKFGVGAQSSRLICGNHDLYQQLESDLANFVNSAAALTFGSGYLASASIVPALCDRHDVIIADKLIHSCLIDGALLSKAKFLRYRHNDLKHLEEMIKEQHASCKKIMILTETIFSMDGDRADINEIINIAKKYDAWLITDDAHGFGLNEKYIFYENHIKIGTFSKALGSYGGYVAGSENLCNFLLNRAKGLIYSTALPANIIAATSKALQLIKAGELVQSLLDNIEFFSSKAGFANLATPIFVKKFQQIELMQQKYQQLLAEGFYVGAIRPPTVKEPRLRISINALHKKDVLARLALLL